MRQSSCPPRAGGCKNYPMSPCELSKKITRCHRARLVSSNWDRFAYYQSFITSLYAGTEAYHPEARKFRLHVRNNAGVFYPTNQNHGIFLPKYGIRGLKATRCKMAAARGKSVKKLTRTTIRAISLAGKALLEEDIVERVCREARGTFSVYFESSLAGEVEYLALSLV